jgi:hypothetical protein
MTGGWTVLRNHNFVDSLNKRSTSIQFTTQHGGLSSSLVLAEVLASEWEFIDEPCIARELPCRVDDPVTV